MLVTSGYSFLYWTQVLDIEEALQLARSSLRLRVRHEVDLWACRVRTCFLHSVRCWCELHGSELYFADETVVRLLGLCQYREQARQRLQHLCAHLLDVERNLKDIKDILDTFVHKGLAARQDLCLGEVRF